MDSDSSDRPKRAKRYSKTPRSEIVAKPTQLGFYPSQWRDVLELAKLNFRRWLACKNAFPVRRANLLGEASECVVEALAEHEEKGYRTEAGKSIPSYNLRFSCLWPFSQTTGRHISKIWLLLCVQESNCNLSTSHYSTPRSTRIILRIAASAKRSHAKLSAISIPSFLRTRLIRSSTLPLSQIALKILSIVAHFYITARMLR